MKINIVFDSPNKVRSGFINIDPFAVEGDNRVKLNPLNISSVADVAGVEELVALDVLPFFNRAEANQAIHYWVSLLQHGGRISLSSVDMSEVARGLHNGLVTYDQATRLVHGPQDKPWDFYRCTFTLEQLSDLLEKEGLTIIKRRYDEYSAVVVAERP